jgi:hypothetical protein
VKRSEAGYLYEIPCGVLVVVVLLALVLPLLPLLAAKVVVVLAAPVVVVGLYYMMVIPGWQPAAIAEQRSGRDRDPYRETATVASSLTSDEDPPTISRTGSSSTTKRLAFSSQ